MKWKWIILCLLAVMLIFAGLAASFIAGYSTGRPNFELTSFVKKVLVRLGVSSIQLDAPSRYESTFVSLSAENQRVPVSRAGRGGGLTSFGNDVVLLTYEGRMFKSDSSNTIRELAVGVPDNGYDAYRRAAESEQFRNLTHNFTYVRYNDILYYRSEFGHGLVISYTGFYDDEACYRTVLALLDLGADVRSIDQVTASPEDWKVLFRTEPCLPLKDRYRAIEGHMAGGRLAFQPPSTLYLASGEYHWDGVYAEKAIAQLPDWDYGKVIEIDLTSGESRHVSKGHRNMQGITLDKGGQLWVVEHGVRGGDELNRVVAGSDYGWPSETLGTMYNGLPWPNTMPYGRHDKFTAPTFAWLPSVATGGLDTIDGFHETWNGDLILGTLADKSLYRLRVTDSRLLFAERIEIGKRIRYVLQHSDGRLVLWTDDTQELIFLEATEGGGERRLLEDLIAEAGYGAEQASTVQQALTLCMECHSLSPNVHRSAPSLATVYDQPIASTSFTGYTDALRNRRGRWTRENLSEYLKDPQAFAPGTAMPELGYDDPDVLNALVDLIAALPNQTDVAAALDQ